TATIGQIQSCFLKKTPVRVRVRPMDVCPNVMCACCCAVGLWERRNSLRSLARICIYKESVKIEFRLLGISVPGDCSHYNLRPKRRQILAAGAGQWALGSRTRGSLDDFVEAASISEVSRLLLILYWVSTALGPLPCPLVSPFSLGSAIAASTGGASRN